MDNVYSSVGWSGLFSIFVTLGFVAVIWVLLEEIKWESFLRHPRSPRARLLKLLFAVIAGHMLADFVLNYLQWTMSLKWLFASS